MKKVTLLFLLAFVFEICFAQNFDFPIDSAKWEYFENYGIDGGSDQSTYTLNGDTIIDSIPYSKVFKKSIVNNISYLGGLRNDSDKVFFLHTDSTSEKLLYDFDVNEGDTLHFSSYHYLILDSIRTIEVNGEMRKKYYWDEYHIWIEGIGDIKSFLNSWATAYIFEYTSQLRCFHQNDSLIYLNANFQSCDFDNTGVDETKKININISPNPVSNVSLLEINTPIHENLKIKIYHSNGRLIQSQSIADKYYIQRKDFEKGMYFYTIESTTGELLKSGKINIK